MILLPSSLKDKMFKWESSMFKRETTVQPKTYTLWSIIGLFEDHLFIIYIKNLRKVPAENQVMLFADDTNVFEVYNKSELESDLCNISKCMEENKLPLNTEKAHCLILRETPRILFTLKKKL